MATSTVTIEPQDIPAAVKSLKAEFASANLSGLETSARGGAVHVRMAIARLSAYQFAYGREHVSWQTPKKKVVVRLKGFTVEQHTDEKAFYVVFKRAAASSPLAIRKASPIRKIFLQRSLRAIEELQALDERQLAEAVEAPTDCTAARGDRAGAAQPVAVAAPAAKTAATRCVSVMPVRGVRANSSSGAGACPLAMALSVAPGAHHVSAHELVDAFCADGVGNRIERLVEGVERVNEPLPRRMHLLDADPLAQQLLALVLP